MNKFEKENINFFNKIAKYYDFFIKSWFEKAQVRTLEIVKVKGRILDAECGTGNFLLMLENKKNRKLKLYGVDISKEMLKIARKKLKKTKLKLMQAENLRFKKKFDFVF